MSSLFKYLCGMMKDNKWYNESDEKVLMLCKRKYGRFFAIKDISSPYNMNDMYDDEIIMYIEYYWNEIGVRVNYVEYGGVCYSLLDDRVFFTYDDKTYDIHVGGRNEDSNVIIDYHCNDDKFVNYNIRCVDEMKINTITGHVAIIYEK